jgi:hypothetical protein
MNNKSPEIQVQNSTSLDTVDIGDIIVQSCQKDGLYDDVNTLQSLPSPKPIVPAGSNDDTVKPLKEGKTISTESAFSPIDGKFRCFYCENTSSQDDIERIKHIDIEHPGKLHHPTPEDFDKRLER